MTVNHSVTVVSKSLKPCPLYGGRVGMKVQGRIHTKVFGEDFAVYNVKCTIKCPVDFLNIDHVYNGHVDVKPDESSESVVKKLKLIMRSEADSTKDVWNRRAK